MERAEAAMEVERAVAERVAAGTEAGWVVATVEVAMVAVGRAAAKVEAVLMVARAIR